MPDSTGKTFYVDRDAIWIPASACDLRPLEIGWLIDRVATITDEDRPLPARRLTKLQLASIRSKLTDKGWLGDDGEPRIVAGNTAMIQNPSWNWNAALTPCGTGRRHD